MPKDYELIGEIVDAKAFKQLGALMENLRALQTEFLRTAEGAMRLRESVGGAGDAKGLETLTRAMDTWEKGTKKAATEQDRLRERIGKVSIGTEQLKLQLMEANREAKLQARIANAQEGSLEKLRAKLLLLTRAWDTMGAAERTSAKGSALFDKLKAARTEVDNLEQSTGRYQRNVGNYTNGIRAAFQDMGDGVRGAVRTAGAELGGMVTAAAAAALSLRAIFKSVGEGINEELKTEGVRAAFEKLDDPTLLKNLRRATRETVSDLRLMQAAVRAKNFQIPLEELGGLLEFARRRAKDAGLETDVLVEKIIDGLGKKSTKVLDDLQISAVELKEQLGGVGVEAASTAQLTAALGRVIKKQMAGAGEDIETASERLARNRERWNALKANLGAAVLPVIVAVSSAVATLATALVAIPLPLLQAGLVALTAGVVALTVAMNRALIVSIAQRAATAAGLVVQGLRTAATYAAAAAQWALNAAMNANPIGVVIGLLAALATALGLVSKAYGQNTKEIKDNNEERNKEYERNKAYAKRIDARIAQMKQLTKTEKTYYEQADILLEQLTDKETYFQNARAAGLEKTEADFRRYQRNLLEINKNSSGLSFIDTENIETSISLLTEFKNKLGQGLNVEEATKQSAAARSALAEAKKEAQKNEIESENEALKEAQNNTNLSYQARSAATEKYYKNLDRLRNMEREKLRAELKKEEEENRNKSLSERQGPEYFQAKRRAQTAKLHREAQAQAREQAKVLARIRTEEVQKIQAIQDKENQIIYEGKKQELAFSQAFNRGLSENETLTNTERVAAYQKYIEAKRELSDLMEAKERGDAEKSLTAAGVSAEAKENALTQIAQRGAERRRQIQEEATKGLEKIADAEKVQAAKALQERLNQIELTRLEKEADLRQEFKQRSFKDDADRLRAAEDLSTKIIENTRTHEEAQYRETLDFLTKQLQAEGLTADKILEIKKRLAEAESGLRKRQDEEDAALKAKELERAQKMGEAKRAMMDLGFRIAEETTQAIFDFEKQKVDREKNDLAEAENRRQEGVQAELARIQALNIAETDKADLIANLRAKDEQEKAEYARKQKELDIKKAKADRDAAIFKAVIDTAKAVVGIWATYGWNPVVAGILTAGVVALGALQIAKISSAPLPKFAKGTKSAPEGFAIIGEEGRELVQEKNGYAYLSPARKSLTYLPKGAKVWTAKETQKILHPFALQFQNLPKNEGTKIDLHETNALLKNLLHKQEKREIYLTIQNRDGKYFTE